VQLAGGPGGVCAYQEPGTPVTSLPLPSRKNKSEKEKSYKILRTVLLVAYRTGGICIPEQKDNLDLAEEQCTLAPPAKNTPSKSEKGEKLQDSAHTLSLHSQPPHIIFFDLVVSTRISVCSILSSPSLAPFLLSTSFLPTSFFSFSLPPFFPLPFFLSPCLLSSRLLSSRLLSPSSLSFPFLVLIVLLFLGKSFEV
jgi:hypothetical protein